MKSSLRVGVVRGGPSHEYDASLKSGSAVLGALTGRYKVRDIFIDKAGKWHLDGAVKSPENILRHVDVIFNALHGRFGEDGQIQKFLDAHGMPYTGSSALASGIARNKVMTKKFAIAEKIKTPLYALVQAGESVRDRAVHLFKTFPHPAIVKPLASGSSLSVYFVSTLTEMEEALTKALEISDVVLVEEYISGKGASCAVVDDFRDHPHYTLPPIEIISAKDAKNGGISQEICPSNFSDTEKAEIQRVSQLMHKKLGLRHYSRSDFIVHPRRGIYFLEVNTSPGLAPESLLPKAVHAVGSSLSDFLSHLIGLAVKKK